MVLAVNENRYRLARERAGLSLGQAARITGLTLVHLSAMEMSSTVIESDPVDLMAEKYGVSVEWLTGACERYDYASARKIKGFSDIEYSSDAAAIAEFAASMSKRRDPSCARCYGRGWYPERKPGTTETDDDEFTGPDIVEVYCECATGRRKMEQGT